MKNKKFLVLLCVFVAILLVAGFWHHHTKLHTYDGSYIAVNPPVETGEEVIEEIHFDGKYVKMVSGKIEQTVEYAINDNTFSLITKYGIFTYDISISEGGMVIDGVTYKRA